MGVAALVADGDQLFRHQLFQPFSVGPAGKVDGARGVEHPCGAILVTRPFDPQEPVGLRLERRRGHRPEPRPAAQPFAADGRIDIGRARHGCRPVEPFEALQRRHLFEPDLARPGIDCRGLVTGVDAESCYRHEGAVGMLP